MIPEINGAWERRGGTFRLQKHFTVQTGGFDEMCLAAFCERGGYSYGCAEGDADLVFVREEHMGPEEYSLCIEEHGITVTAAEERGVIWALATLTELAGKGGELGCQTLADRPRLGHRGLLLDCTRHFFEIEEVRLVIDEIARVKLNVLHWHLSDDQGFRIESKRFPKLHQTEGNRYYTQQEIRETVAYARLRGVEVIPELDMPGHTTGILAAYPEYSCSGKQVFLAKTGGIYPVVLCPGKEKTYRFLEELLGELVPLFDSQWFHIGGDETPDGEWNICGCCRKLMEEKHYVSTRQLQGHFSGKVKEILGGMGKKVICWNDSLEADNFGWEDGEKQALAVQFWSVQYADAMQAYIRRGGRFIYSDMFELYLDYPCAMSSLRKVYHTVPMIRGEDYTGAEGFAGMECCLWTEYLTENGKLEERLFPRIYAFAENAWHNHEDYGAFTERLREKIEEARGRGIHCLTLEQANPQGEERKQEIKKYTAVMQGGMPEDVRRVTMEYTKPGEEFEKRFMEKFFGAD